jgi:putative ABC transport system ATP-binding protein
MSKSPILPDELLESVGLSERARNFPTQLSGGEQQRVAIARAVSKNPLILLCDEPTGALDFSTGIQVLRILKDFNEQYGKTIIIITHNASIGAMGNRVFYFKDGLIDKIVTNEKPIKAEEVSW